MIGRCVVAWLVMVGCGAGSAQCTAQAQWKFPDKAKRREPDRARNIQPPGMGYVRLAMASTSEEGWNRHALEAIHRTLRNKARAHRQPLADHIVNYCTAVFDMSRRDYRAWIPNLRVDTERPKHWPVFWWSRGPAVLHPPWAWGRLDRPSFQNRWASMLAHARKIYDTDRNPCRGEPLDWGCYDPPGCDDVTAYKTRNPEWVEIDCGDTRNVFLRPRPAPLASLDVEP